MKLDLRPRNQLICWGLVAVAVGGWALSEPQSLPDAEVDELVRQRAGCLDLHKSYLSGNEYYKGADEISSKYQEPTEPETWGQEWADRRWSDRLMQQCDSMTDAPLELLRGDVLEKQAQEIKDEYWRDLTELPEQGEFGE